MKALKFIVKTVFTVLRPIIYPIVDLSARSVTKLNSLLYKFLFALDWFRLDHPEWFDHRQDLYWRFPEQRLPMFLERGVIPRLIASAIPTTAGGGGRIEKDLKVLDLCCGDGFYSEFFLSEISNLIISIDLDPAAIKFAQKHYGKSRNAGVKKIFIQGDIEKDSLFNLINGKEPSIDPTNFFDVILFNAAIEHFTEAQVGVILKYVDSVLTDNGFVFGYTLVEDPENHFDDHELFFTGSRDLRELVNRSFTYVVVMGARGAGRHNLYFAASRSNILFNLVDDASVKSA